MTSKHSNAVNVHYDLYAANARRPDQALPVMFIMGFGMAGRVWRYILPEVPDRERVTFDNRGSGASPTPHPPYRMADLAEDALALMDRLGWPRAHVVGVSMGGMIAQEVALAAPERVASLTLIATHPGGMAFRIPLPAGILHFATSNLVRTPARRYHAIARLLFPAPFRRAVGESWLERVLADDFSSPAPAAGRRGQLAAILRHDTRKRLPQLSGIPTLVIQPGRDVLVAPRGSDALAELIPGAQKITFHDAGHGLIRQKAIEIGIVLREHFTRAEGSGAPGEAPTAPAAKG